MADDPNIIIGELAAAGIVVVLLWRCFSFIKKSTRTPDPWDAETEKKLHDPDAVEICHRCFTPVNPDGWFCEHCGSAVGPYNNLMPFIHIFSEGEVWRNGTTDRMRNSPLIPIGYFLISFSFVPLIIYRPFDSWILSVIIFMALLSYWSLLLKNFKRSKAKDAESPEENLQ